MNKFNRLLLQKSAKTDFLRDHHHSLTGNFNRLLAIRIVAIAVNLIFANLFRARVYVRTVIITDP